VLFTKKTHETDEISPAIVTNRHKSRIEDVAMDRKYAMSPRARSAGEPALDPPGFDPSKASRSKVISDRQPSTSGGAPASRPALDAEALAIQQSALRLRRAYAFAQGQLSGIGMMAFMMWMSGNSVQIFSIMTTFGGVAQTVKAVLNSKATFAKFADDRTDVTVPRIMYCAIQIVGLSLALNKLNSMGLLPTHASDWVSGLQPPRQLERAFGGTELGTR
jgi:hypothetical protein